MIAVEVIQPFPLVALPRLWRWVQAHRDRIADDYFAKTLDQFVDDWELLTRRGRISWGVYRDGQLGGAITTEQRGAIVWDLHCVFSKAFWGHDITVPALMQACRYIFDDRPAGLGADKISTDAFADNLSLSGMVKALGGFREGTQRGQTRRGGALVDVALLGLQKERFNVVWHQSQLVEHRLEPALQPAVQPNGSGDQQRRDDQGPDARTADGPKPDHAADPRPGNEPRAIPGAAAESGA